MRQSISAGQRLEATLIFLARGCSYSHLQFLTRISQQSLSAIIPETCDAIYLCLNDEYMKVSIQMTLVTLALYFHYALPCATYSI